MNLDAATAWVAERHRPVLAVRELRGGWTSTMLAVTHDDDSHSVLRVMDREPWATHRVGLTTREHETQLDLVPTPVPAPRSIALRAEDGLHLMTLLPGAVDESRADDASLGTLAATLAAIHDVRPPRPPRTYQSWAQESKHVVPTWARRPEAWREAFALLCSDPPAHEPTFLHRDFQPRNVLWSGGTVSGVVDWVETSTGPAWLDVAHCATAIAVRHGVGRGAAFAASYAALTGRSRAPHWEVMDVVGHLPAPGRADVVIDPDARANLEDLLLHALGRA